MFLKTAVRSAPRNSQFLLQLKITWDWQETNQVYTEAWLVTQAPVWGLRLVSMQGFHAGSSLWPSPCAWRQDTWCAQQWPWPCGLLPQSWRPPLQVQLRHEGWPKYGVWKATLRGFLSCVTDSRLPLVTTAVCNFVGMIPPVLLLLRGMKANLHVNK